MYTRVFFSISVLIIVFYLEGVFPYFKERKDRLKHAFPNLIIAIINALVIAVFFLLITAKVAEIVAENSWGLLRVIKMPYFIATVFSFILLDLWMYLWHVANHRLRFFWLFHRMHHTDQEMNSTTALRFHAGEILFSSILQVLVIVFLLGIDMFQLSLYGAIFLPIVIFHHSNIGLPEKWDRIIRSCFVTPNMHRVHHSEKMYETNSNYSSVFSFWDRLFKTFRKRQNTLTIHYGIKSFYQKKWQTLFGMILTPFK
ncbi:MAG: hypothetical protein KR126chlam5_01213 [Candidatus Anoxychlamydiales bacterium]|nr:hypothetical protein [Candidatus Anoxychlamydiales bacterium]